MRDSDRRDAAAFVEAPNDSYSNNNNEVRKILSVTVTAAGYIWLRVAVTVVGWSY